MFATFVTSLALLGVPITLGALAGAALRRARGRRFCGLVFAITFLVIPAVPTVGMVMCFPIIGLWDGGVEGLLAGAGVLWSAHRALQDRRNVLLLLMSLVVSLLGVELYARLFLPPPPGFPTRSGPHFLLANALRAESNQPWDTRCKEVVCSIVYGEQYAGIFDPDDAQRGIVTPRNFTPRPEAVRRVLHLGDSMGFGFGLHRDETFSAVLERLEVGVQHINAAVPGTAPDAYLAILRSWIATHRLDLVVMHIYEGNDLDGLDSRFPCCDWQSLLQYGPGSAALRCPQATPPNLGHAGLTWLRYHNPAPYLVRALVGTSSAAAYLAAALAREPYFLVHQPTSRRLEHLELILRSARDACAARHIPLVVVVLPARTWVETLATWQHYAPSIVEVARRAGAPVLDTSEFFRDAHVHGQSLFFEHPGDIHFNANAHALLAKWLQERLANGDW